MHCGLHKKEGQPSTENSEAGLAGAGFAIKKKAAWRAFAARDGAPSSALTADGHRLASLNGIPSLHLYLKRGDFLHAGTTCWLVGQSRTRENSIRFDTCPAVVQQLLLGLELSPTIC